MSNIDFEEDQTKMLGKTENIQSLADQVERLSTLQQEIEKQERKYYPIEINLYERGKIDE